MKPVRGLGRGLDALLPARASVGGPTETYGAGNVFNCPLERLTPNRSQPRRAFDEASLEELAESIRQHGLLEPIVARKLSEGDAYEIIAGERRWRACQKAGLREALVIIRDVSSKEAYELALIENIQREDLNAIEFAHALDHLLNEHAYTQDSLARRVGKDRSTVANALRLLRLPEKVRNLVISGELTEGHARALLGAPSDSALALLAERVINGRYTVRQTEDAVRQLKQPTKAARSPKTTPAIRDLESRLARRLGSRCRVADKEGKGSITIPYASLDELDRILELIFGESAGT